VLVAAGRGATDALTGPTICCKDPSELITMSL
jgi:hypothetical protein